MKKIFLYLVIFACLFCALPALAQDDYVIRGTVLDEFDKPIAGATVRAGGIDKAVVTDKDGNYSIIVPKDSEIIVSCVGFKTAVTTGGKLRLKVLQTNVKEVVAVAKKKKQDLSKVKMTDPKAIVTAVDTLLHRMPTQPAAGAYDTAVIHKYIKNEIYEHFNKNAEVMTGVADAYYNYVGERKNWVFGGVTYPDTFWITNRFCADSIYAYRYIDYAIKADSTYGPAYELAGNIQRDEGRYLEAMKWYRRGMKNAPKSPENYLAFAKLVINNDTASALRAMRELAKKDSIYPANLELARMYYDLDELGRAANYYYYAYWDDSLKRSHFVESDYNQYLASNGFAYQMQYGRRMENLKKIVKKDSSQLAFVNTANLHTNRFLNVARAGLEKYPDSEGLIRQAFYLSQRLEMNGTAKQYAEKLFSMPNVKLITDDYLTYAKLYASEGDLASADEKYNQAFEMCLTQIDEIDKEAKNTESDLKIKRLTRQKENLKNNEDVIVNEHTRLYTENFERKINIAQYYIDKKKSFGRNDYVEELNQLGAALAVKAQSVDTAKMVNAWKQVDAVYAEMAELSPKDASNATNTRLLVVKQIDALTGEKTGVAFCEDIYNSLVDSRFTLQGIDKQILVTSMEYLLYYHYDLWDKRTKNKRSAQWVKLDELSGALLEIDGNNSVANQVTQRIY